MSLEITMFYLWMSMSWTFAVLESPSYKLKPSLALVKVH